MRLLLSREAVRGLRGLPRRDAEALYTKLEAVAAYPMGDHPFAKAFGGKGRVRQGDWRAVYQVDREAGQVRVIAVAARREVYR